MKWFNRFCICFVLLSMSLSLCLTSFATESVDSLDNYSFDLIPSGGSSGGSSGDVILEEYIYYDFPVYTEDDPLPVTVIDDDDYYDYEELLDYPDFYVLPSRARSSLPVIGDDPPANPLFYGSCWVSGYDSNLGDITIYFPLSCKEDTWGVDSNGYLYNISSGSVSGYLSGVYNNAVSASGFSYPRYRESSGSSYTYVDLHLRPVNSNMEIAITMEPAQNVSQLMPYVYVVMLGVIIVCFMKRF